MVKGEHGGTRSNQGKPRRKVAVDGLNVSSEKQKRRRKKVREICPGPVQRGEGCGGGGSEKGEKINL